MRKVKQNSKAKQVGFVKQSVKAEQVRFVKQSGKKQSPGRRREASILPQNRYKTDGEPCGIRTHDTLIKSQVLFL